MLFATQDFFLNTTLCSGVQPTQDSKGSDGKKQ